MVYLQGSGANATKLGEAHKWTIKTDSNQSDDGSFGDTWETSLRGRLKWSGSVDLNLDSAETSPFDAATATSTRKLYLYPDSSAVTTYYYGTIWPNLSATVDLKDTE